MKPDSLTLDTLHRLLVWDSNLIKNHVKNEGDSVEVTMTKDMDVNFTATGIDGREEYKLEKGVNYVIKGEHTYSSVSTTNGGYVGRILDGMLTKGCMRLSDDAITARLKSILRSRIEKFIHAAPVINDNSQLVITVSSTTLNAFNIGIVQGEWRNDSELSVFIPSLTHGSCVHKLPSNALMRLGGISSLNEEYIFILLWGYASQIASLKRALGLNSYASV